MFTIFYLSQHGFRFNRGKQSVRHHSAYSFFLLPTILTLLLTGCTSLPTEQSQQAALQETAEQKSLLPEQQTATETLATPSESSKTQQLPQVNSPRRRGTVPAAELQTVLFWPCSDYEFANFSDEGWYCR